ncbi:hypothetical protein MNBD_CPR01-290 [hydrothermal vent metagenome]|uniref:Uncharacterized protein n=1 Tax=hydrothermal vent metagenome TaxID=652676 RepID=A0A3B0V1M3_9ZZZZ
MMKRILYVIALGIIVFVVWSIYSSPHISNSTRKGHKEATTTPAISVLVSLKDIYHRGIHTITGAVVTPTPCYTVDAETKMVPSTTPPVIRLDLSIPPDTGRCLQLSATTTFSVKQKAKKDARLSTYINGVQVATSTIF